MATGRTIVRINLKGGVGKSTISRFLRGAPSLHRNKDVLAIIDPHEP